MVILMNVFCLIKEKIKKNGLFYLVYTPCVTFIVVSGLLLLCYPEAATEGVRKGISVCTDTLIPTLFPFMLLSQFATEFKLLNIKNRFFARIFEKAFRLPLNALPIILFSFIGGFPLGALLIKSAYEKGELTLSQGQRMLLFCINPAPSFAISTIGYAMYGSDKNGVIIYLSSVISSVIIAFLTRFLCDESDMMYEVRPFDRNKLSFSSALSASVNTSVRGIVNICVWVVIFSCLGELISIFNLSQNMSDFLLMISEVTNGVYSAALNYNLPTVCAVIGFAGFCLHIQVLPAIMKLKLRYRYFLVARIISAAFSCIICYFFMDLFKSDVTAAVIGEKAETVTVASSVPVCICLMAFCGLFVAGEDIYKLRNEKNKKGYQTNKTELY